MIHKTCIIDSKAKISKTAKIGPYTIIGSNVEIEDIKPESSFTEDLEADSLDVVELIMALEEEFSTDDKTIEISDEDAENIRTVQNAVDFITSKGIE